MKLIKKAETAKELALSLAKKMIMKNHWEFVVKKHCSNY